MNNKIIAFVVLVCQTICSISFSQDGYQINPDSDQNVKKVIKLPSLPSPVKNEIDVGEAISPMKKGQVAPFTGLLLSPSAVASIVTDIELRNDLIKIEVKKITSELRAQYEHEIAVMKIRNDSDVKILTSRVDQQKKELDYFDSQLKKERESRPNPITWAAIGLAAGVVLSSLATTFIISVSNNN